MRKKAINTVHVLEEMCRMMFANSKYSGGLLDDLFAPLYFFMLLEFF